MNFGFLTLIQWAERPEQYGEPIGYHALAAEPSCQAIIHSASKSLVSVAQKAHIRSTIPGYFV